MTDSRWLVLAFILAWFIAFLGITNLSAALAFGLVDEVRLWVHPIILGTKGPQLPHFRDCLPTQFDLVSSKTLPNGIAILNYQVKPNSQP